MCHAVLLETVAAVPGVVGGRLLHCKSLRRFEQSGGIEIAYFLSRVASSMHIFWHICENSRSCSDWSRTSSVVNIRMMPSVDIRYGEEVYPKTSLFQSLQKGYYPVVGDETWKI
ncbi:UBIQUINOL OXIDASE 3 MITOCHONDRIAL [Salix purpurea]|uniref:Ubiquinol oxidase n=1 Tax=Salix purpurea TaxID=77065 RepID=A0A9Q0ZS77_SALPP|nr:UBIQUINOL OXIDASE 3 MITOCHONDRIAL [Salix purpurea]